MLLRPLWIILTDVLFSPLEIYFKQKKGETGILKYRGYFTNKLISICCVYYVVYLSLLGKDPAPFLLDYFIYDLSWICSNLKRIKYNYIFIIHHVFTGLLCFLGRNQNFGYSVYIIFEFTSPLLHITKISEVICPKYYQKVKWFTKQCYFFFRCLIPPFWILFKLLTHYNGSWRHTLILSGITALWKASIMWHKQM
jgi:hypothetical protein